MKIIKDCRGFHQYGVPLYCTYGTEIRIKESSAASGPYVWLFAKCDGTNLKKLPGEASAHLNPKQVRALIARLQTWLDEIPTRWGKS